jgi:hypothetical protein
MPLWPTVKLIAYIITLELRGEYTIPAAIVATTGTVQLNFLDGSTIRLYSQLRIFLFAFLILVFKRKARDERKLFFFLQDLTILPENGLLVPKTE